MIICVWKPIKIAGQQDPSWWPFNCVCPSFSKLLTFPYNSDTHKGQGFLAGWYYLILILMDSWIYYLILMNMNFSQETFPLHDWNVDPSPPNWPPKCLPLYAPLRPTPAIWATVTGSWVSASQWLVDGSRIQWTGLCVQLLHVVAE